MRRAQFLHRVPLASTRVLIYYNKFFRVSEHVR
jgi:hypothetical protein